MPTWIARLADVRFMSWQLVIDAPRKKLGVKLMIKLLSIELHGKAFVLCIRVQSLSNIKVFNRFEKCT